jgi:hypothetical protein
MQCSPHQRPPALTTRKQERRRPCPERQSLPQVGHRLLPYPVTTPTVTIGAIYADLGASITALQQELKLGLPLYYMEQPPPT